MTVPATAGVLHVVETSTGAVRGRTSGGVTAFHGVPYAMAPVGEGRFLAPQPHARWSGVRDSTVAGPTAPQATRSFGDLDMTPYFGTGWHRGEDYLTLDLWAPARAERPRPVMVFVHGGGFVAGSTRASLYDGSTFARDGVITVAVNYRLGIIGFLDIPGAVRNRGLLDVLSALDWVQENIAAFGGDPGAVTVFGQSAGAILVAALVATPDTSRSVRRAITQSGSGTSAFTPEQGARVAAAAAHHLGIEPTLAAFASLSDERLVEAQGHLGGTDLDTATAADPLAGISTFSLVLDQQPVDAIIAGTGADIDLLAGSNTQEGNLYLVPQGRYDGASEADLQRMAVRVRQDPAVLLSAYRSAHPGATASQLRAAILGDALFGRGTRALQDAHSRHDRANTYGYEFAWPSPALGGRLGATHTTELPFVFDRTDAGDLNGEQRLLGPHPAPRHLATAMHAAWLRFATTGEAGWPQYTPGERLLRRFDQDGASTSAQRGELAGWT